MATISRENALTLWKQYNTDNSLLKHAYAVEAAMRHYATLSGEDADEWGVIGILHDIDYEQFPNEHCIKVKEILEKENIPYEFIRAIQSHGYGLCTDIEPQTLMEKTLYAVDELTGFIVACALVRPSKSLDDLELKSVKKKWKDFRFASGVDRKVIENGASMLGVTIEDLIKECIIGLRPIALDIGLSKIN